VLLIPSAAWLLGCWAAGCTCPWHLSFIQATGYRTSRNNNVPPFVAANVRERYSLIGHPLNAECFMLHAAIPIVFGLARVFIRSCRTAYLDFWRYIWFDVWRLSSRQLNGFSTNLSHNRNTLHCCLEMAFFRLHLPLHLPRFGSFTHTPANTHTHGYSGVSFRCRCRCWAFALVFTKKDLQAIITDHKVFKLSIFCRVQSLSPNWNCRASRQSRKAEKLPLFYILAVACVCVCVSICVWERVAVAVYWCQEPRERASAVSSQKPA